MPRHVYIKTFGCQMNEHDSSKVALLLGSMGYESTPMPDDADVILFNTCTIREKAYQKAMSDIGRSAVHKCRRPGVKIGIMGCAAQQAKEALTERFAHIDFIVGPDQLATIPDMIERPDHQPTIATTLINDPFDYAFLEQVPDKPVESGKAFVTIMKGCNYACSYCIVPAVRGKEVCRPAERIVEEVAALVERGVKEVTLLGQTVNAYRDPSLTPPLTFAKLIQKIAEETRVQRIRFMSPHPLDTDEDLVEAYRTCDKLCSHIHLPVQSGSTKTLKNMRRGYTRERYEDLVARLRTARQGLACSTDIIVGFPGERDDDFAATLSLVRNIAFDAIFAFAYSPRPGTAAARQMADDVPKEIKEERLQTLLTLGRSISREKHEACVGRVYDVLVAGPDRLGSGRWTGRSAEHRLVHFSDPTCRVGDIVPIRVTRALTHSLEGDVVRGGTA